MDERDNSSEIAADSSVERSAVIPMWSGEALSLTEASVITTSVESRVIFLAGMPDSGKTTLIAALYEKFQRGPFAGWLFAGSRTLVRCEEICHYARLASANDAPSTQRTRQSSELELVHLALSRQYDHLRRDMLLTDISGERFRQVRDSTEEAQRLHMASNASRLALFLDAGRLSSKQERQTAARDSRQILQSFIEAQVLTVRNKVDLIVSRTDLASGGPRSDEWLFIDSVASDLQERFASKLGTMTVWKVAARPPEGYNQALGLAELFKAWLDPSIYPLASTTSLYASEELEDDFGDGTRWLQNIRNQ